MWMRGQMRPCACTVRAPCLARHSLYVGIYKVWPTAQKRAHEEQASFNEKVQEAVGEASEALETATDSPAVQRAKAALQQGSALLAERQKLIAQPTAGA